VAESSSGRASMLKIASGAPAYEYTSGSLLTPKS
jgi:hypothetical protein